MNYKALEIKNKIISYYEGAYINYTDLINHLKRNMIDRNESVFTANGYNIPEEGNYPAIFYYDDNSLLIVTGGNILAVKEIK